MRRDDKIGVALKTKTSKLAKIIAITENTGSYNYDVFNNGSANLRNVELSCSIITRQGYPEYEFPVKVIPKMIKGRYYPVEFKFALKETGVVFIRECNKKTLFIFSSLSN